MVVEAEAAAAQGEAEAVVGEGEGESGAVPTAKISRGARASLPLCIIVTLWQVFLGQL